MRHLISSSYEHLPQTSEQHHHKGSIRHFDYGDRVDVMAEDKELRHELGSFKSTRYLPSMSMSKSKSKFKAGSRPGPRRFGPTFRRHRAKFRLLGAFIVAWPIFWWIIITCIFSDHPALFPSSLSNADSTLVVVAHPDDECLFFAPVILAATQRAGNHGALLVLSSGNHYGLGETRRKELKGSCSELGIRDDRCEVMDISSIQDNPIEWWPVETITKVVSEHIDKWMIDSIVTFDHGGVSGHINHRAVSAAVTQSALSTNFTRSAAAATFPAASKPAPSLFVLNSVFLLRKYSGLYDLPLTFLGFVPSLIFGPSIQSIPELVTEYDSKTEVSAAASERERRKATSSYERGLLVSGWSGYRAARKAFWQHQSQLVWDRHLYMLISRYMYFNTIERVI
ncbi:hypothetical protein CROQUDRAFT_96067 [Cronartium quercuum f. sp. fusiforme G11]|uniref:N-acetylglucosaminylphosphatidylinositol deacetylase n=1 Tax=Cronartium quercuum f. sp. fusiforme G11 TaxID=708437 RepID=A0A9P6NCM1_9BASI|nr:hypothetical protein CROQUDRAFT_96067 [Cronartium quercuum f. sp. fusiforme G11]